MIFKNRCSEPFIFVVDIFMFTDCMFLEKANKCERSWNHLAW